MGRRNQRDDPEFGPRALAVFSTVLSVELGAPSGDDAKCVVCRGFVMSHHVSACLDCGVDTMPCTHRRGCRHAGRWEDFMVWNELWSQVGAADGVLCVGCLERRLGRVLVPDDFTPGLRVNVPSSWDTLRLAARKSGLSEAVLSGRWPPARASMDLAGRSLSG